MLEVDLWFRIISANFLFFLFHAIYMCIHQHAFAAGAISHTKEQNGFNSNRQRGRVV